MIDANLRIADATTDDAPTIVALVRAAFEEYRGQIDPPSGAHKETVERVIETMQHTRVALARVNAIPVGCVFYERDDDTMHLSRLAVLPTHRRNGIGRALVAYVEAQARAMNLARVQLGVRVALTHLQARYERWGYHFVEWKTHEGYTQHTYLILEKVIRH